jgi:hypothetical protein
VIFHPGTDIEITPSKVTISAGMMTIEIPRCRMVKATHVDNPDVGWPYADVATWGESTVDVKRRYNDQSTQVVLSSNHSCSVACAASGCTEYTQTACGYIKNPTLGAVEIYPANYVNGSWVKRSTCCSTYDEAQLNYLAGVDVNHQIEDTIVRLAHSKMPAEPCGCDPIKSMWSRDRNVPVAVTRERANCPFGLSDGAWTAWMFTKSMKLWRGGIVG